MGLDVLFSADFWAMGGHGFFVWTSYGFCALALGALAALTVVSTRRRERELAALDPSRGRGRARARSGAQDQGEG